MHFFFLQETLKNKGGYTKTLSFSWLLLIVSIWSSRFQTIFYTAAKKHLTETQEPSKHALCNIFHGLSQSIQANSDSKILHSRAAYLPNVSFHLSSTGAFYASRQFITLQTVSTCACSLPSCRHTMQ